MPTIQEQFEHFHRSHPEVYVALVKFARDVKQAGGRRLGIGVIWERMRWHMRVDVGDDLIRFNNNHRSRYARLIMQQEQDLDGFFELRKLQAI